MRAKVERKLVTFQISNVYVPQELFVMVDFTPHLFISSEAPLNAHHS